MKKFKKPLSILLAAIMAISVCTVGFTALAADEDEPATEVETVAAAQPDVEPAAYAAPVAAAAEVIVQENLHELFKAESVDSVMAPLVKDVVYQTLIPSVAGLLNEKLAPMLAEGKDLKGAVESLFNNDTVTEVAQLVMPMLYETIAGILNGLNLTGMAAMIIPSLQKTLSFTPEKVAIGLDTANFSMDETDRNQKYVENELITQQLKQFADAGTVATLKEVKDPTGVENPAEVAWAQFGPGSINWGVEKGDYETFMNAILSMFNCLFYTYPNHGIQSFLNLSITLDDLLLTTRIADDGTVLPTGYDALVIPLLEALGADPATIPTSAEYAKYTADRGKKLIDYVKPILDLVYTQVLTPAMSDPVDWLAGALPNLLYHLEDGCVFEGLDVVLDKNLKLNFGTFDTFVQMQMQPINLKDTVYGLFGENAPEKIDFAFLAGMLDPILASTGLTVADLMKIARLGTPKVVASSAAQVQNTVVVEADKASVLNYIGNLIYDGLLPLDLGNGMKLDFNVNKTFVKQEAPKYPHDGKMNKDVMNAMINGLDGLLSSFINLNDTINGLMTNVNAAKAIQAVYGALDGVIGDLFAGLGVELDASLLSPSMVADMLPEDNYKDLKAALQVNSWADVALIVMNGDEVYSCEDMGFEDGDRQGFINCLVAAFRPLVAILMETGLVTNQVKDGTTIYGLYETLIIPVYEALGLTPAATSVNLTDNFNKLSKQNGFACYDYVVNTILDPILGLVNQVAAAPAATLMKVLPNLAYAIQYNPTLAFIGNLLDGMGGLTGLVNGLVQGIATGEDAAGNPIYGLAKFELPAIPLDALASCGEVKEVPSKSALHKTYTTVVADPADAFVTVFYYLHEAINYKENLNTIKDLLAGIEGIDPSISTMIGTILNDVFTLSREEALCALGSLLASDVWECPDGAGNSGDGTPSTGDSSIPAAVVLLMMVSAGGAVLLLKKKKPVAVK